MKFSSFDMYIVCVIVNAICFLICATGYIADPTNTFAAIGTWVNLFVLAVNSCNAYQAWQKES